MPEFVPDCLFCEIAQGKVPSHEIWSDDSHMAFLTIFPNTAGATVVIPKQHYVSYAFAQEDKVLADLILATKKVAHILDSFYEDVGRCGMVFEGFGVDHLHAKLYPLHGTGSLKEWQQIESQTNNAYFETYPGYISSNDSHRADDQKLALLAGQIRQSHT